MSSIKTFQDMTVWQRGHQLVLDSYGATKQFPRDEIFALTAQLRRAVVSVTSNIAEGFSRQTKKDKINFYHISLGSCTEVQNQLRIARDLSYLDQVQYEKLCSLTVEIHKMLNALIKSIKE